MATPGIAGLLASARRTNTLPELEPGTVMFNRLWPLAVLTIASGVIGFFLPQVPVDRDRLLPARWRSCGATSTPRSAAVEGRDGVEFWFDKSSPFGAPKLLRLPGLRRVEPVEAEPVR